MLIDFRSMSLTSRAAGTQGLGGCARAGAGAPGCRQLCRHPHGPGQVPGEAPAAFCRRWRGRWRGRRNRRGRHLRQGRRPRGGAAGRQGETAYLHVGTCVDAQTHMPIRVVDACAGWRFRPGERAAGVLGVPDTPVTVIRHGRGPPSRIRHRCTSHHITSHHITSHHTTL